MAITWRTTFFILCLAPLCRSESAAEWRAEAREELTRALGLKRNTNMAKNVILFLGDGMGISTVTAARIYRGQLQNRSGEEGLLAFERFPNVALSKTYNDDAQTPDSAGTATAFLCGVKVNTGVLGVDSRVKQGDCQAQTPQTLLTSIADWAREAGKSVGVVTTTRVTHATPGALYAKSADRNWESDADVVQPCKDIASQLTQRDDIQVILGGGRRAFFPVAYGGRRQDGRNLTEEWLSRLQGRKAAYVQSKDQFDAIDPQQTDFLMGLFASSHMAYEIERNAASEPSLAEMAKKAIGILSKNPNGFFLLVEGGRIDHGHHNNSAKRALHDTLAFEDAVTSSLEMTSERDTLSIVTADHTHVFNIAGYPKRGNPLFGLVDPMQWPPYDNLSYTTLVYANGPGEGRRNLTHVDTQHVDYQQTNAVRMADETHGGSDVAIYAQGPMGHLFHGVHEQHYIAHVMAYAACMGDYSSNCRPAPTTPDVTCAASSLSACALVALEALFVRILLL